ncbi:MAG: 50S ribosomal protein L11 methyltransferase [Alphaproteobacteria bacterium]
MKKQVYSLNILCPNLEIAKLVQELFEDLGYGSGLKKYSNDIKEEKFYAQIFMYKKPDKSDLASKIGAIEDIWGKVFELSLSDLSDTDWVSKNQISFKPFEVEKFFIYQDFYKGKIPNDKIPLKVQASVAFGTGSHPTTAGALKAISSLNKSFNNIIDVGTGTGILSVAMAKSLKFNKIIATDIDKQACDVAQKTFEQNNVSGIDIIQSDGINDKKIIESGKYDLFVANILAKPLIEISKNLKDILTDDAVLILSGIDNDHTKLIIDCYSKIGVVLSNKIVIDDWVTLIMIKNK